MGGGLITGAGGASPIQDIKEIIITLFYYYNQNDLLLWVMQGLDKVDAHLLLYKLIPDAGLQLTSSPDNQAIRRRLQKGGRRVHSDDELSGSSDSRAEVWERTVSHVAR